MTEMLDMAQLILYSEKLKQDNISCILDESGLNTIAKYNEEVTKKMKHLSNDTEIENKIVAFLIESYMLT